MEHNTILLASGGIKCVRCSLSYFGAGASMMGACLGSKPATAEPPEWKGEVTLKPGWLADDVKRAADRVDEWSGKLPEPITGTVEVRGTYTAAPLTPYGRALSDFIERRKAKRAEVREDDLNGYIDVRDYLARAKLLKERAKALNATEDLSRAMLTPITFTARLGVKT